MPTDSLRRDLEVTLKTKLDGEVRFDTISRFLYSTDASNYQIEPVGVVIPRTVEDVARTVETAARYNVPILPRGGGTSLAGQAVGHALVIDFSKYLNEVLELNPETGTVRVQPGIYLEQLNRYLKRHNLMFGPDPATARVATMGGVIGNNATGTHSILYGMAGDNLKAAQVVLSDSSTIGLNAIDEVSFSNKANTNSAEGRLYKNLLELRNRYAEAIKKDFPKHWRRASGYSLPYLLKSPFNPAQLLASSEGTLAVATEFTLNLVPRPLHTGLTLLQFTKLVSAMEAVPVILEKDPSAIELIDRMLISLTREHPGYSPMLSFVEGDPEAILAVEFYGQTEREVEQKTHDLVSYLNGRNVKCSSAYALSPEYQANVWGVRRAGLGLLMSKRDNYKPIPCIEDVSVPVENLSNYVANILDVIHRLGTKAAFYGHASAGCLHVRPLVNLKATQGVTLMKELTEQAFELALRYGGVMSGEHGDGLQRSYLNEKLFGPTLYQAMRELKTAFDRRGLLNPGKVVDAPMPDENLRYTTNYRAVEISTYLDWSKDKGFTQAVEMCNGQGLCRKIGEGIMCPSYMATRDEMDTTRGRANALRAVISGRLSKEALASDEMYKVYDLCLACKGCKRECPSGVDVAKMKTEFLAHYHSARGLTIRDRIFGYIHEISRISSHSASLANFILDNSLSPWLLSQMNIHPNRSFPRFAGETFTNWFYNRQPIKPRTAGGKVVYFHDTWTSFYYPEVGQAAVKLLEAAGFEVILVPNRACCGRPMLSKGMVEPARSRALRNVELLSTYARKGIPIIGTEPSCILTFRDEYPDLLPRDYDVRVVADSSFLLEEFLLDLHKKKRLNISWKSNSQSVFFHGHCHQRALIGSEPSLELLRLSGCSVRDSGAGCCGMAGSFGYEKEHYEISKRIGEDRLFPAIRQTSPETVIAVSGVSCRQQVEHFVGRRPKHIAEVLVGQLIGNTE
ncbi:MAG TPA: FAD-linked oxidase C-terminal domain-containing protein [Thermodesulfobacteriota bacterium]|nr:FAD-linked oxidase C-terminal domain-containing protein [Thermodesulfobacteriota bacterium]